MDLVERLETLRRRSLARLVDLVVLGVAFAVAGGVVAALGVRLPTGAWLPVVTANVLATPLVVVAVLTGRSPGLYIENLRVVDGRGRRRMAETVRWLLLATLVGMVVSTSFPEAIRVAAAVLVGVDVVAAFLDVHARTLLDRLLGVRVTADGDPSGVGPVARWAHQMPSPVRRRHWSDAPTEPR